MEKSAKKTDQKPLGVFDALSGGFELIWLNPWILLVPIALDLFLWLGPQVSAQPIFQRTLALLPLATPPNAPADTLQNIELLKNILQTAGGSVNVLGILTTGMPSVIGLQPPAAEIARAQITLADPLALSGLAIALLLGAVLITGGYLELTARPVRNETDARTFVARWLRASLNLILLAILVVLGVSALMIPVALVAGTLSIASQGLGSFLLLGGMMLMFWAMLYLVFAVPAIFVSRVNAPQALLNSVSIFRFDFWSAIGLVFVAYLLRSGFTIVWQLFDSNTWGVVFVLIANAFLSSALTAAEMIFYNDRMYWLAMAREKMQQQKKG
ncbi:MAG: hypothetical protein FJ009_19360 [Chloroflexi bacterium]|nr:hypothetical protein [Chloroflexota bacterium]